MNSHQWQAVLTVLTFEGCIMRADTLRTRLIITLYEFLIREDFVLHIFSEALKSL